MDANCTKSRIRRYFLRGFCRSGQACRYRHERLICRHFQRGSCHYGKRCRFLHVLQGETAAPQTHHHPTETRNSEVRQEAVARVTDDDDDAVNDDDAFSCGQENVENVTCGICMDNVYAKSQPKDSRFGILPKCIHSFCEQCILTWRHMAEYSPGVVKGCPLCRVRSDFYVPSESWVGGGEKEQLIVTTKKKCRDDYCSFFAESGLCPFEEGCRYATARARDARLQRQREVSQGDCLSEEGLCSFISLARSSNLLSNFSFVHRF